MPAFAFSGPVPPHIARLLSEAAAAYGQTHRAEAILWSAQALAPSCLTVYFSLYKFYFYKNRLEDAERVTRQGLAMAARLGAFEPDWRAATAAGVDWCDSTGPRRFYLFSLKALAFIRLRRNDIAESAALLAKLAELDPSDRVGAGVIRDLARAVPPPTPPAP